MKNRKRNKRRVTVQTGSRHPEGFIDTGIGNIKNSRYMVDLSYPLHILNEPEDPSKTLRQMAATFEGEHINLQRRGVGRKDIIFGFRTHIEALAFMEDVKQAQNPFVSIVGVTVFSPELFEELR